MSASIVAFRLLLTFLTMTALTACVSSTFKTWRPKGWTSSQEIEKIVHEDVPLGSSIESTKAYFERKGIKLIEFPAQAAQVEPKRVKKQYQLGAYIVTRVAWPEVIVMVIMTFGDDQRLADITVHPESGTFL